MAVTTSPTYHRSPIHDGFATIRSARSRIKTRNLANVNTPETVILPSPPKHAEYFTLRRNNKKSFLENNNDVEYFTRKTDGEDFHRRISLNLNEPIYAKVTPPTSPPVSPCKVNGHSEVHYDSIDIKPSQRISKNIDFDPDQTLTIDRRNNIVKYINGDKNITDKYSNGTPSTTGSDLYSDTSNSYRNSGTFDDDITSHRHSYTTETNNSASSENSDLSNVLSSDTEDVLKELPSRTNYRRSPQKYATLNSRRPRSIEFKSPTLPFDNSSYGSLQRNGKVRQFHSEPNTPVTSETFRLGGFPDQQEVTTKPPIQRNGFRRSSSDNNGFATKLNYRHSFSVDSRNIYVKKPHTCCECVTGIPADDGTATIQRTLGTLYESAADQKVGCQTILRPKPPVPWWELAIKKTRYKSCPILDEAHVVSAFEQSLSNMTQRLQQLTATAERKDSEVTELRQTIELLRKQSIQAGLTTAHMQSMGIRADGVNVTTDSQSQSDPQPPTTCSPAQHSSPQRKPPAPCPANGVITRHLSTDSVSSINSISSGSSAAHDKKLKKKGWLRSSFTKAFSRNAKISKTAKHSSLGQLSSSSVGGSVRYDPLVSSHTIREGSHENSLEHSHEITGDGQSSGSDKEKAGDTTITTEKSAEDAVLVDELKRQLREKDLVLTDIRLEALSSAHQLESLKDTVVKMRNEMLNLKQNNERLQRLVTSRSLAGSQTSIGTGQGEDPRRFSLADQSTCTMHQNMDIHPQPLDLDFNCITSTPTNDFTKKLSPISNEPIYGNNACELTAEGDALLASLSVREGDEDMFSNSDGMRSDRMSGGEYADDIDTLLPPPKSRELAIGESYSDMAGTENQGDTADGKKIAIAVYLGQPDTFQRYYEEVQDTLSESEVRLYQTKQAVYHTGYDSPRLSQNHSPESENQMLPGTLDYSQSIANKSNTNSLKSNKSSQSTTFKNMYSSDATINTNEFTIAYTYISGKTTWQNLDYIVRKTFKDYLSRIDPGTNLGLNTDSITSYHLGDATRGPEISFPELLPCGYIVGTVNTLYICLQGVGSLAFDSLIPKNIVYRYISLLSEHRRVILCGPSGTGKSYLATKLAEFYVRRHQRRANPAEAVATFNVEHKSALELRAYLSNIAEQCGAAAAAGGDAALPSVLLLDNLQHASALGDAFAGLRASHASHMPVIIGTMSQATCNTTNLQLQHNFRWLLTSNHMEPVKGFLARYLRRKLVSVELERGARLAALGAVLEWLPGVWQHLNAYLEAHSSSDVAVGPRLFLACPMDLHASQVWFAEVWNYSVVPYVRSAVREGVALYGRRRGPPDPLAHVKHTYPWREPNHSHTLLGISLEDIGLDETTRDTNGTNNQDPLLNMLMRLQEAANYSGEQSQDSDNISLDSNLTHDSSAANEM